MVFSLTDIGVFTTILVAVCTALYFVLRATFIPRLTRLESDFYKERDAMHNKRIDCTAKFTRVDMLHEEAATIKRTVSAMCEQFLVLTLFLKSKFDDMPDVSSPYRIRNSPMQVTEKGYRLLSACGGASVLEQHMEKYIAELESRCLKSPLDVEEKAQVVVYMSMEEDYFVPIKNFLYQTSRFEESPVSAADVCSVMGLALRDEYLRRHPEILPS